MAQETNKGVAIVCTNHVSKRKTETQKMLAKIEPDTLVGSHIMVPFSINSTDKAERILAEPLWIKVVKVDGGEIMGVMASRPAWCEGLAFGCVIAKIPCSAIEDVIWANTVKTIQ